MFYIVGKTNLIFLVTSTFVVNKCFQFGYREYLHSVAVYQKYLTRLGELIIFEPWRENYHFSQPS